MDFLKLFIDYKIPYNTRVNRGWVNTNCPYCDTKIDSFNMGFNPSGDYCTCWKCGGHSLRETLALLIGIKKSQLDEILPDYQGRTGIAFRLNDRKIPKATRLELPTDTFTSVERKYLRDRGYSPKFLHEKYGLVGGGVSGKWKYRIIVPLIVGGRIVSWTGRSILSKDKIKELNIPRYKNLSIEESIYSPKDLFYNIDNCNGDTVVITEGAFDVMRLGDRFGNNDNVICSWGTTMTQSQISTLKNKFKKVYMMFDNEPEAQEKARKFGLQISAIGLDVEIVNFYEDFGVNDGDECSEEQVAIIRKEFGFSY